MEPPSAPRKPVIAGKYEVGRLLRRGATGVVHYGRWLEGGAWTAAVLKIEACAAPKKQMQREVSVYRRLAASSGALPRGIGFARCAYDTGSFAGVVARQGAPDKRLGVLGLDGEAGGAVVDDVRMLVELGVRGGAVGVKRSHLLQRARTHHAT